MLYLLIRVLHGARTAAWALPAVVIGGVFLTSWPLMVLAEGRDAPIVTAANYWWWFLITSSTVGYGDYYPVTALGHIVGIYVVVGGIATLTTLFARIASAIETVRGRRTKGAVTVSASGHIVILGYTPGRTERIVDELSHDGDRRVVLGAWDDLAAHPMPERAVEFVRGDLTTEPVLRRAGVHTAASVLIDARDDNEALAVAVTAGHIAPGAHTVVALRDMDRTTHIRYVNASAHTVQWHSPRVITEELQSPGISRVYAELMTHGGRNTYSLRLPEPDTTRYGDCQLALGRDFQATLLAADTGVNLLISPAWESPLPAGSVLYYVSQQKILPQQLTQALRQRRGTTLPNARSGPADSRP